MAHGLPEGPVWEAKKALFASIWKYGEAAIRSQREGIEDAIRKIEQCVDSFENDVDMAAYNAGEQAGLERAVREGAW